MLRLQATTSHRIESEVTELNLAEEVKWPGPGPEGMDRQQLQINNGD